ncbi:MULTISPECIES: hypothetical protein [unclassified Arthrobacter]|uniref:hypothetical protein n=1 Tax=unclassified Arthrobacter TaxID=235627 RepID=UPI000CFA9C9F|nr:MULTISPECIES: hypothetical protein [unclassified Arthrobacter]
MKRLLAVAAVAALSALGAVAPASAAPPAGAVCPSWDTGHIDGSGGGTATIMAPEGMVITAVCVKAGSAKQGNGPEYTYYDPGVSSVTNWHSSGKDISHYSVMYSDGGPIS